MTEDPQRRRGGRRAVALYLAYVLLTTAVAALLVQLGVTGLGSGRGDGAVEVRTGDELTIGVGRSPRPKTSPSPAPTGARPATTAPAGPRGPASPRPGGTVGTRPPSGGATTRPPTRPPTTAPPRTAWRFYLDSGGRTTAAATLPMLTAAPPSRSVPNYDADRNPDPGLTVAKGGSGPAEADSRKVQAWSWTAPATTRLKGGSSVTFWSALAGFRGSGRGVVTAYLQHCASTCSTIATSAVERTSWSGGAQTWVAATAGFGTVDRTLAAGHRLRVVLVVGKSSSGDMWFAYDTAATPSSLRVG